MPVQVQLSDDQHYLIYEISEPLMMDDLMAAYKREGEIRDSMPHVVHSIVDMSQLRRIPVNWLTAKAGPGLTHPRSGEMLFVGVSVGLKMIVQTIMRIMNYKRMKLFDTREQAEAYMQRLIDQPNSERARTSNKP